MAIKEIFESNTDKIDLATQLLSEFSDREGQYVWKKLTAQNGTFVDYVTADSADAYPNGALADDGYWYELVREGSDITIDGVQYKEDLSLKKYSGSLALAMSTLPYSFYNGAAVFYRGEIHLLGGEGGNKKHYKWDGSTWVEASTLPYEFIKCGAVVFNDEIHILGSGYYSGGYKGGTKHYKWNGSTWQSVSTLPYEVMHSAAVVYNNGIHILGGEGSPRATSHYRWDGTSWKQLTNIPSDWYGSAAVVYGGAIHLFGTEGTNYSYNKHLRWNGSSWSTPSTVPYSAAQCEAYSLDDGIHVIGSSSATVFTHYRWNGSAWTKLEDVPYSIFQGSLVSTTGKDLHMVGGLNAKTKHMLAIGEVYRKVG